MNSNPPKAAKISSPSGSSGTLTKEKGTGLMSVEFEIRGKVQGVFFRKYTQAKAKSLGLRGWCQNTNRGTVIGVIEGDRLKIDTMKDWLRYTGSPKSNITLAKFSREISIPEYAHQDFTIVK